jgi:hypothetical protein
MRRHAMNAYKAYITNNRSRGLYVTWYDSVHEALNNYKNIYMYLFAEIDIRHIASTIDIGCDEGKCDVFDVYNVYDPDHQVLILIVVDDHNYFQVVDYSLDDANAWDMHIDCCEKVTK